MNKTERIGIINTFVGGTLWEINGVMGSYLFLKVICQIVLIKKFRLWPDIIKRIFENKKLKNSLFSLLLNRIII